MVSQTRPWKGHEVIFRLLILIALSDIVMGAYPDYEALKAIKEAWPELEGTLDPDGDGPLDWPSVKSSFEDGRNVVVEFTAQIPGDRPFTSAVTWLTSLTKLDLREMHFTAGAVLPDFNNLTRLRYLDIRNFPQGSPFPVSVTNLTNLEVLTLRTSQLTGALPNNIGQLANLVKLDLAVSQLSGTIPSSICQLTKLAVLDLSGNRLTTLPSCIGQLTSLENLGASSNPLGGTIPTSLGQATSLRRIDLDSSLLTGLLPSLESLHNLTSIVLFNNSLSGNLPSRPFSNQSLAVTELSKNNFIGSIPSYLFSDCSSLVFLGLRCNSFDVCSDSFFPTNNRTTTLACNLEPTGDTASSACKERWNHYGCSWTSCGSTPVTISCRLPRPQPEDAFVCDNGVWVSIRPIDVGDIEIQGPTVISGNFTVNNTLTFSGLEGSIHVNGCAELTGDIEINLSQQDLDALNLNESSRIRQLLTQNCSSNIGVIPITLKTPKQSCRRTTAEQDRSNPSNGQTLTVVFRINSNKCKLWWIVLASVLGAVILLLVVFALLATFNSTVKAKVRPFWARSNKKAAEGMEMGHSHHHHNHDDRHIGSSLPCGCPNH